MECLYGIHPPLTPEALTIFWIVWSIWFLTYGNQKRENVKTVKIHTPPPVKTHLAVKNAFGRENIIWIPCHPKGDRWRFGFQKGDRMNLQVFISGRTGSRSTMTRTFRRRGAGGVAGHGSYC